MFIMKKTIFFLGIIFFPLVIAGCATSVPVTVTRPAELDLHGAKSISILPFQLSSSHNKENNRSETTAIINFLNFFDALQSDDPDEISTANYLTSGLMQKLSDSRYIQVVDSSSVQRALENGTPVPTDVYLTGRISRFDSDITSSERTERQNDKECKATYYTRIVAAAITYQIVDAKTNRVVAYKTKDLRATSREFRNPRALEKPFDIIRPDLDRLLTQIMKEIQPYSERKYISLISDKTKDPDMKTANKLVKEGFIVQSRERFMSLYKTKGYFEAGYNAGKLLQAEGKLQEAEEMMSELVNKFGNSQAVSGLSDIKYEIDQAEILKGQSATR